MALCLMFHNQRQQFEIQDLPTPIKIEWDGTFELAGDFFILETKHPMIGNRAIAGFPLEDLRKLIDRARSVQRRVQDVIFQADVIDLTPEIINELVRSGWNEADLLKNAREGGLATHLHAIAFCFRHSRTKTYSQPR